MEFTETYEKDKGPVVRWIATKILNVLQRLEEPLYDYALMYEVSFDDEENENLSTPYNQMGLFDDLEVLPQFENLDKGLL